MKKKILRLKKIIIIIIIERENNLLRRAFDNLVIIFNVCKCILCLNKQKILTLACKSTDYNNKIEAHKITESAKILSFCK